jgi:hypothetical protein
MKISFCKSRAFLTGLLLGSCLASFIVQLLQLNATGTLKSFYMRREKDSSFVNSLNLSGSIPSISPVHYESKMASERINPPVPAAEYTSLPNLGKHPQEQEIVKLSKDSVRRSTFSPVVYNLSKVTSERSNPPVPFHTSLPNRGKDPQEQQIVKMAQEIVQRSKFETKWLCLIILNEAYIRLLDNWLCGLHRFQATEVVIFDMSFSSGM